MSSSVQYEHGRSSSGSSSAAGGSSRWRTPKLEATAAAAPVCLHPRRRWQRGRARNFQVRQPRRRPRAAGAPPERPSHATSGATASALPRTQPALLLQRLARQLLPAGTGTATADNCTHAARATPRTGLKLHVQAVPHRSTACGGGARSKHRAPRLDRDLSATTAPACSCTHGCTSLQSHASTTVPAQQLPAPPGRLTAGRVSSAGLAGSPWRRASQAADHTSEQHSAGKGDAPSWTCAHGLAGGIWRQPGRRRSAETILASRVTRSSSEPRAFRARAAERPRTHAARTLSARLS